MTILLRDEHSKKWEPVDVAVYEQEKHLQELLAETPSLISLAEIREDAPPLVYALREAGLPGSGKTDLLAFNAAGDIVIVECKLAANPEIKRTVIAQVFEYGAYLWGMNYDDLNELVHRRANKNLADLVGDAAGDPAWNEEEFRANIKENLASGRFVLVIAVDAMNDELTRTIRFLNTCGNPTFAFTALEMRRYQKGKTEILVPHLFGSQTKATAPNAGRTKWTKERFQEVIDKNLPPAVVPVIMDLYAWSQDKADRVQFGTGGETGSYTFHYLLGKKTVSVFSVYTTGNMSINFGALSQILDPSVVQWLHQDLVTISGFSNLPPDLAKFPSVKIGDVLMGKPTDLTRFKAIVEAFKGHLTPAVKEKHP